MTTELDRRLYNFTFPVEERKVFFEDRNDISTITKSYKAIVRQDTDKLISIMNDTYKIIPNSEIIKPLMEQLHSLDTTWHIDNSHSFVEDNRMRLQITFPELTLNDGRSDISLSLFLHNSYDGSEGIRMYWGAIRYICRNGMVFGEVLSKFYGKHTQGLRLDNLKSQVEQTYENIPAIKNRINQLLNTKTTEDIKENIELKLGKTIIKYVEAEELQYKRAMNQWALYNILTYYISHEVEQRLRAAKQFEVSKIFKL